MRVGIAGYGLAGRVFHAPLIEFVDGLEVSAVMTRSPERAAQARAAHPGARTVAELDELLDGIDVLVVATPNSSHVALALAGIERGLAVVVDKPLAPTAAEARRVLGAGGRLTVFHNRRWDADFLTAQRLVRDGALGEVVRLESRFERFRPVVDPTRWREQAQTAEGGGLLLDLGPHLVDQAVQLLGPPLSVYCELDRRRPGAEVDDDVFIALQHEGGARSHLWMSQVAALAGPRLRVSGTSDALECEATDPQEQQLADGMTPGDADYGTGPPGRTSTGPVELERGRYQAFYEGVRDWARDDSPPPVDPADGLRVLELLETARRAAEERSVLAAPGR